MPGEHPWALHGLQVCSDISTYAGAVGAAQPARSCCTCSGRSGCTVVLTHHPLGAQVTVKASAIVPARSAVLRGPKEREVLDLLTARLAAVSLAGYIFFGSSVNISDQARCSLTVTCLCAWVRVGVVRCVASRSLLWLCCRVAGRSLRENRTNRLPAAMSRR
jgi:hypothetical protein